MLWPSASPGCPYDFVSLEWLQQWLDESTPPKAIDNTACLCSHGKLHPDKIPTVKRVSEEVADYFYKRYGGGPRLTGGAPFWTRPFSAGTVLCRRLGFDFLCLEGEVGKRQAKECQADGAGGESSAPQEV